MQPASTKRGTTYASVFFFELDDEAAQSLAV